MSVHPTSTLKRTAFGLPLNTGQRGQDVMAMKKRMCVTTRFAWFKREPGNVYGRR